MRQKRPRNGSRQHDMGMVRSGLVWDGGPTHEVASWCASAGIR